MIRDYLQEVRQLGPWGTAFRVAWELRSRLGLLDDGAPPTEAAELAVERLPFAAAGEVRALLDEQLSAEARQALIDEAEQALEGKLRCFRRWTGDFGQPLDWYLNPRTGARWPNDRAWSQALRGASAEQGDIKHTWEAGRFPQAYALSRAALVNEARAETYAEALTGQIRDFHQWTPYGMGVHWASSQEVAFRVIAWLFADAALLGDTPDAPVLRPLLARALHCGATHTDKHIGYARHAVHNNHLLSEALLLLLAGQLLPGSDEAQTRRRLAIDVLDEQSPRQFYADGGYIQQSHNYQRLALQVMMLAARTQEAAGATPSSCWLEAIDRSIAFLHAHQNPADGRLPNYGFNDGALPLVLSTCDFADFRPTLQAANLLVHGERLYPPGPWDEEAAWLIGPKRLAEAPLAEASRASRTFGYSGHHVLRDEAQPGCFGAFRCGTLRDRFSQIDMLHVDVWWRGQNVLTDPGSYQYNGAPALNRHFMSTASHNTLTVDGRDQMRLLRQWKVLYFTEAELLRWQDDERVIVAAGEHRGFERHPGGCRHRRAVLFAKPELWVVVDQVTGEGAHDLRLHWQGGAFPHRSDGQALRLETPQGDFGLAVFDGSGASRRLEIATGSDEPFAGWVSRYYGDKVAAPSVSHRETATLPATFISVLGPGTPSLTLTDDGYEARAGDHRLRFALESGLFTHWEVA